jgi:ABC-type cobalt transport system substrate-binding protein
MATLHRIALYALPILTIIALMVLVVVFTAHTGGTYCGAESCISGDHLPR